MAASDTPSGKGLSVPKNPALALRALNAQHARGSETAENPEQEPAPPAPAAAKDDSLLTSYKVSEIGSDIASYVVSNIGSKIDGSQASALPSDVAAEPARTDIEALRSTPLGQLNVRVPQGLSDWLDDYAHRHRKRGVTKQSLVQRAIEMLIRQVEAEGEGEER